MRKTRKCETKNQAFWKLLEEEMIKKVNLKMVFEKQNLAYLEENFLNYRILAIKRTAFYIFLRVPEWLYIQILYVLIEKI